jgi:hypothetical protein
MYDYYYSLTPRQFFNTLNGRRKHEDSLSKERWILARKVAYFAVVANLKDPVDEIKFMPFPWESKMILEMSEATKLKQIEDLENSDLFWEEQDRKERELAGM